MGRSLVFSSGAKTWVVLTMSSGEIIVAGAAGKEKASEQSLGRWEVDFLEAGKTMLVSWEVRPLGPWGPT